MVALLFHSQLHTPFPPVFFIILYPSFTIVYPLLSLSICISLLQLSELFVSFEEKPQGAASLAQVHKAVLHDGRTVAVKVQHPKVQRQSSKDIVVMEVSLVNCFEISEEELLYLSPRGFFFTLFTVMLYRNIGTWDRQLMGEMLVMGLSMLQQASFCFQRQISTNWVCLGSWWLWGPRTTDECQSFFVEDTFEIHVWESSKRKFNCKIENSWPTSVHWTMDGSYGSVDSWHP